MAVCHNSDHIATLSNILKKYIRTQIEANQAPFSPSDKQSRLDSLKPERLAKYEKEKGQKRQADVQEGPLGKRRTLADNVDGILGALAGEVTPKRGVKPSRSPQPSPSVEDPAPTPSPALPAQPSPKSKDNPAVAPVADPSGPADNISDLLKAWA